MDLGNELGEGIGELGKWEVGSGGIGGGGWEVSMPYRIGGRVGEEKNRGNRSDSSDYDITSEVEYWELENGEEVVQEDQRCQKNKYQRERPRLNEEESGKDKEEGAGRIETNVRNVGSGNNSIRGRMAGTIQK
ncbi:hypothetical protein L873DRAFT_820661 [Choiromyces venosus 120613-1]|uniref:Uncharacterized protein n=1 Tax=Choiromyces venosus 120613-1 TaxID=1336337 RepID=A0A3N4JVS4_9PEZI|nr:hypothetical protein L873DRAFT_820661 [Choiromyces venosus 120613-1]